MIVVEMSLFVSNLQDIVTVVDILKCADNSLIEYLW